MKEGHHKLQHSELPCVPVGGQGHALGGWTPWQVALPTPKASRVPCSAAAQVGLSPPNKPSPDPPTFPGGPVSLPLTSMPKDFSSRDTTTPCPPPFPNHPRNSLPRQKGHQQRHLHLDHHWVSTPNNLSLPKTHGRSNCKVELSLEAEVVLSLALAGILWTALQFLTLLTASNTSPTNGSTS